MVNNGNKRMNNSGGLEVTTVTEGAACEDCSEVCARLYKDLTDYVKDDPVTLPSYKMEEVRVEPGCPSWVWWWFGLSLALFLILFSIGACLACSKK